MLLCHSQGLISTNHKEPESVFNRWQLLSFPMWKMVNSEEGFEKQKDATLMHYCTDDVPNRSSVQLPMATKIPASANRTAAKTCRSFQTRSQTFAHCGYFFLFVLNGSFWTSLPADYFVNSKAPNHTSACDMAPGRNFHLPTVRVCKHPWNHMQIRKKKKPSPSLHELQTCSRLQTIDCWVVQTTGNWEKHKAWSPITWGLMTYNYRIWKHEYSGPGISLDLCFTHGKMSPCICINSTLCFAGKKLERHSLFPEL